MPTACSSSASSTSRSASALSKKRRQARSRSDEGLDNDSSLEDSPFCNCLLIDCCGSYQQTRKGVHVWPLLLRSEHSSDTRCTKTRAKRFGCSGCCKRSRSAATTPAGHTAWSRSSCQRVSARPGTSIPRRKNGFTSSRASSPSGSPTPASPSRPARSHSAPRACPTPFTRRQAGQERWSGSHRCSSRDSKEKSASPPPNASCHRRSKATRTWHGSAQSQSETGLRSLAPQARLPATDEPTSPAQVAPGSHEYAERDQRRLVATPAIPRRYAQTRINRPPPHVHGKEGVNGSSPAEGSAKASKWPFLLPQRCTHGARASLNLSPRSIPNIAEPLEFWLEQRRVTSSSTSVVQRASAVVPAAPGRRVGARVASFRVRGEERS